MLRVVVRVLSPAGGLTTKSITRWLEPQPVASTKEDGTSLSWIWVEVNKIWKQEDKRPDQTRHESGTEAHGGAR